MTNDEKLQEILRVILTRLEPNSRNSPQKAKWMDRILRDLSKGKHSTVNALKIGSTRSGKSYPAISDVLEDAASKKCAIFILDPHGDSLAWPPLDK